MPSLVSNTCCGAVCRSLAFVAPGQTAIVFTPVSERSGIAPILGGNKIIVQYSTLVLPKRLLSLRNQHPPLFLIISSIPLTGILD